jgi:RNA polymerase sigma-70 factor (ECF subfamily)
MKQRSLQNDGWLTEFKKGSNLAFQKIFDNYYRALCFFACKWIQDKEEAEDMVAETFTKLWQRHDTFENEEHIKSFLYLTTKNACLNLLKHKQVKTTSQNELLYLIKDEGDTDSLHELIETELLGKIYRAIEQLPKKCRQVANLIFLEGLSTRETAEILKISERNVLNQKSRAIQILRTKVLLLLVYLYIVKSLM